MSIDPPMYVLLRKAIQARKRLTAAKNALWPAVPIDAASELLLSETRPEHPPELTGNAPPILLQTLPNASGLRETAYVRRFEGRITIDPRSGMLFSDGRVIWHSTDFPDRRERTPLYLRHRSKPRRRFDAVASLHHIFDNNFFHFFNNIAVKLPLFEAAGVPADIPVVVSQRLAAQPFFRDACQMGLFGDREVVVQGSHEVIAARTVYTAKGYTFLGEPKHYDWVLDRLRVERKPTGARLVFIHRGPKATNRRTLRNQTALDELLERHSVEKIDPQDYDLAGQIQIFSSARLIVGTHGAGLTNMIFRREAPLDIIEMFNPNFLNGCYYWMAQIRGYGYSCLLNEGVRGSRWTSSAEADIKGLERELAIIAEKTSP